MKYRAIALAMAKGAADQETASFVREKDYQVECSNTGINLRSLDYEFMVAVKAKTDNPACRERHTKINRGMA